MVKKEQKIFIWLFLILIMFFSLPALAEDSSGLVKCGLSGIETCSWNDLFVLINNVITFLIKLALVLTTIAIVVSGIQLVWNPSNSTAHSVWKNRLQTALIGLVVMLAAFLIVKAIVWGLTGSSDPYGLRNVQADSPSTSP